MLLILPLSSSTDPRICCSAVMGPHRWPQAGTWCQHVARTCFMPGSGGNAGAAGHVLAPIRLWTASVFLCAECYHTPPGCGSSADQVQHAFVDYAWVVGSVKRAGEQQLAVAKPTEGRQSFQ